MKRSSRAERAYQSAINYAASSRKEFLTPEYLLWGIMILPEGWALLKSYQSSWEEMKSELVDQFMKVETVPNDMEPYELIASSQLVEVIEWSEMMATAADKEEVDLTHLFQAILNLDDSAARYLLKKYTTTDEAELLSCIVAACNGEELPLHAPEEEDYIPEWNDYDIPDFGMAPDEKKNQWRALVTCVNDLIDGHNPLIGREPELERTIQVLCRKEKNNPLHVGEPGVGKTALVYGLAERIEQGRVPERLKGARIYQMDMGSMVAGTTYRGDFEKRIKAVMEGVSKEGNSIVYIDEIHTLVGAGAGSQDALDGSNMLKPYLEAGQIRFIGSTTYQEYNRYFQKSKGLVRRFQQIDIAEPSIDDTIQILNGLKQKYEDYHGIQYADDVIPYAVEASARLISDRFLPDKAIDLIDEAGAYRELHPLMRKYRGEMRRCSKQVVDKSLINDILARVCKINPKSLHEEDNEGLETLDQRIKAQIYGQDEAVRQVVEAVQMGKAGLLDQDKPIASLLFVGPTGVGKTEVCKVLAKELGIELIRFDMSEYAEKHTVAKLIGSPAGYVGYEDGGLLTDAIRRTPHCVLLLDEIEKAHSDIYNILLQVMDYARLTDNKGQKADFRHVILVMTSNAGAQYSHQASLGFGVNKSAGEAMMQAVKKSFKPEFLNRLSSTVVFNDMDLTMASLILDKKIGQLQTRLASRHVTLTLSPAAHDYLLRKGYTAQYGAREMDRVINSLLSPLLTREILFGKLKKGGEATVELVDERLNLNSLK